MLLISRMNLSLRSYLFLFFLLLNFSEVFSQQYPFWSQYRSGLFLLNPAVAGTRKTIDARAGYRNQWVGFEGAPKTMSLGVHGKFFKHGTLGAGGFVFNDVIGPFSYLNATGAFAYHLKFSDAKLSFGVSGSYQNQGYVTSRITTQYQQDNAIDFSFTDRRQKANMGVGMLYYNDRFYLGFAALNLVGSTFEYYPKDTIRIAKYKQVPHYNFAIGYNWQATTAMIWENSFIASMVPNTPILADYTLRIHIQEQFIIGAGYRFKTAVAFHVGYTFKNEYQFTYSYDITTNHLRSASSGSHEIKLVFSSNLFDDGKRNRNKEFQRQKFQNLLQ